MVATCTFALACLLTFSVAQASEALPYYGENFPRLVEQPETTNWKKILFELLTKAHKRRAGLPDEIGGHCAITDSDCYQHMALSYQEARALLFGHLFLENDNNGYYIKSVYCQTKLRSQDFPRGRGPGPGRIPDPNILNTEHTWPQSRFSSRHPTHFQKSDLHALFPEVAVANSTRSNLKYARVVKAISVPCQGAQRGMSVDHPQRHYFEPPDEHKGNVARALFYFSVRYELAIDAIEEKYLREWHQQDPVDASEMARHEEIFAAQKVRNPFVDYPWLADRISDF